MAATSAAMTGAATWTGDAFEGRGSRTAASG